MLPVYPATEGLSHQQSSARWSSGTSTRSSRSSDDVLPAALRRATLGLPTLAEALRAVHGPSTAAEAELGRRRLAFDELFDLQLMLVRARTLAKRQRSGMAFEVRRDLTTRLRESLPWTLTGDQQQALREIAADMTAPERMHRLLMGDVGTGKTVVALFAMLLARGERLPGGADGADRAAGRAARAPRSSGCSRHSASGPSCCSGRHDRGREAGGPRAARLGAGAARGRAPMR